MAKSWTRECFKRKKKKFLIWWAPTTKPFLIDIYGIFFFSSEIKINKQHRTYPWNVKSSSSNSSNIVSNSTIRSSLMLKFHFTLQHTSSSSPERDNYSKKSVYRTRAIKLKYLPKSHSAGYLTDCPISSKCIRITPKYDKSWNENHYAETRAFM